MACGQNASPMMHPWQACCGRFPWSQQKIDYGDCYCHVWCVCCCWYSGHHLMVLEKGRLLLLPNVLISLVHVCSVWWMEPKEVVLWKFLQWVKYHVMLLLVSQRTRCWGLENQILVIFRGRWEASSIGWLLQGVMSGWNGHHGDGQTGGFSTLDPCRMQ